MTSSSPLLIAFATQLESSAAIELLKAIKIDDWLWEFPKGRIAVTGMGTYHAAFFLTQAIQSQRPSALWNLGFAADLKDREIGTIEHIKSIHRPPLSSRPDKISRRIYRECYPPLQIYPFCPGVDLVTVDAPVHCLTMRKKCAEIADLLDLEGYGVAAFARMHQIECKMVKIVSDRAQGGGRNELLANAPALAHKLAVWLVKALERVS